MAIKKLPATGDRPQHSPTRSGLPEGIFAGGSADSAGFAWEGRSFEHHDTAFASDDGTVQENYLKAVELLHAAVTAYQNSVSGTDLTVITAAVKQLAAAHQKVFQLIGTTRVLVPLVAVAGEYGLTPEGKKVEKTQELSIVTVAAADGRKTLPIFSSSAAMQAWDAKARPIPVPLPQALIAAAQEECELVIIDPGSSTAIGLRFNQFAAVATGENFSPCWADAKLAKIAKETLMQDPRIKMVALLPGDLKLTLTTPETELVLGLVPNLDKAAVNECVSSAIAAWQANSQLEEAVDSLKVRVLAI